VAFVKNLFLFVAWMLFLFGLKVFVYPVFGTPLTNTKIKKKNAHTDPTPPPCRKSASSLVCRLLHTCPSPSRADPGGKMGHPKLTAE
jgi:hypothetical protein